MANKEIGRIGQRRYGGTIYEEFLHELRGTRGIEVYREMSENDDVVGAILFAIEMKAYARHRAKGILERW